MARGWIASVVGGVLGGWGWRVGEGGVSGVGWVLLLVDVWGVVIVLVGGGGVLVV